MLVELLVLGSGLLDLLGLLGLLLVVNLLDLGRLVGVVLDLLGLVLDLLLDLLGDDELDGVRNELGLQVVKRDESKLVFPLPRVDHDLVLTCFLTISLIFFSSR